jgi:hypothetical protein
MYLLRIGLFTSLTLVFVFGCGRQSQTPARVKGVVTLNGQPVKGGNVTFHSADLGSYRATLSETGTYELIDLPAGSMKVTIETEFLNPKKKAPDYGTAMKKGGGGGPPGGDMRRMMEAAGGGGPPRPPDPKAAERMDAQRRAADAGAGMRPPTEAEMAARYTPIPAGYTKVETTPLSVELQAGNNTFNFDLKDD